MRCEPQRGDVRVGGKGERRHDPVEVIGLRTGMRDDLLQQRRIAKQFDQCLTAARCTAVVIIGVREAEKVLLTSDGVDRLAQDARQEVAESSWHPRQAPVPQTTH